MNRCYRLMCVVAGLLAVAGAPRRSVADVPLRSNGLQAYLECQQPERWEKRDWRILGVSGYANALYRTNRPGSWVNLVYGTAGAYGLRNAFTGMRGWLRNIITMWTHVSMGLARENVADELLDTTLSAMDVHPCWWALETDKLETAVLQAGNAYVIPVILHGDQAGEHELSLASADLKFQPGCHTFGIDLRLAPPEPLDAFKPVPWRADYITLMELTAHTALATTYTHRTKLEPQTNYYHILSQTPAWVYSVNGQRTALLLPENRGVTIRGVLPVGSPRTALTVENTHEVAQILAYTPAKWAAAWVTVNGVQAEAAPLRAQEHRLLRFDVGRGRSRVMIAESAPPATQPSAQVCTNPQSLGWSEAAERVFYHGLTHRAYEEDGKSSLELTGDGEARFPLLGGREAGGFSIKVRGHRGVCIVRAEDAKPGT
ncbi:MAG: hypothetical protein FJ272_08410 [Planctomycetes bacterium]|nr:hypothetical protein [Planctomycetota bacterium]